VDPRLNTESTADAAPLTAAGARALESKKYENDHTLPACAVTSTEHNVGSEETARR
jgi:hypothetical protein